MDQDIFEAIKNLITFLVLAGLVGVFFVFLTFFFSILV